MRDIRNEVNETVILSVRSGDFRVHIDFVEGLHPMRRMADLGVRAPLYAGAASKVLLAGMEDDEIEAYLDRTDLTAFQKSTITDRNVLWREVRLIRKRGFAESKGELFPGGGALAAPIKDFSGKTVAVMDILTPEHRYTAAHRERCIAMLLDGARRASERLGYRAETQARRLRRGGQALRSRWRALSEQGRSAVRDRAPVERERHADQLIDCWRPASNSRRAGGISARSLHPQRMIGEPRRCSTSSTARCHPFCKVLRSSTACRLPAPPRSSSGSWTKLIRGMSARIAGSASRPSSY